MSHYRTKNNRERFKIEVLLDGNSLASAEDYSKKSAEQKASKKALIQLGLITKEANLKP
jgi:ribonuclease-3